MKRPYSEQPGDLRAAQPADEFFNGWFLDSLFLGEYPGDIAEVYGESMPEFSRSDTDGIRIVSDLHALGINCYLGKVIRDFPKSPLPYEAVRPPGEQVNGLGWSVRTPPVYPEGLRPGLGQIHDATATTACHHCM